MTEIDEKMRAGFWSRIGAWIVDATILGIIGALIGFIAFDDLSAVGELARILGLAIALLYFGISCSGLGGGRSPGQRLFKLRVIALNGQSLSLLRSSIRGLILVLPMILNGIMLKSNDPNSTLILSGLAVTGLFGLGLAQIYLYIFNRPGRRLAHDLLTGSAVVRSSGGLAIPNTPRIHATVAVVIVLATLALAIIGSIAAPTLFKGPLNNLLKPQSAINALPEVIDSSVGQTTTFVSMNGKPPQKSQVLVVAARLRNWPTDGHAEVSRIRQALGGAYAFRPGERLQVKINYGFNLGIASGWRGFTETINPTAPSPTATRTDAR